MQKGSKKEKNEKFISFYFTKNLRRLPRNLGGPNTQEQAPTQQQNGA